ncbi:hypothetical protein Rhe02_44810 [Rhizocola hellebori]|uniref:Putative amidase domain-containing protein n=1 Tax=Rhizocola hellebori TaxID=1392758 RepID=A0A8J3VGI8_9ACTN|nr:amidase domain-containing protein [Rhizocola hellebori]GIH06414.1 hypothetical protein Rhe02_44810 [Rhizocola hellebori]
MSSILQRTSLQVIAIGGLAIGLMLSPVPAEATWDGYRVTGTGGVGLKVRTDPYNSGAGVVTVLSDGTAFSAVCAVRARDVLGNTVWHRISAPVQGWISDYYTTTPGFNQYIPGELDCNQYNRASATSWALAHWNDPEYYPGNDCTWFVSQALWIGGLPQTATWYPHSVEAVNADSFKNALVRANFATIRELSWSDYTAGGAQIGDVIGYDWNPDGRFDHVAIVTSISSQIPIVTQHSVANPGRQWWKDSNGNLLQNSMPGSRVYLLHVVP